MYSIKANEIPFQSEDWKEKKAQEGYANSCARWGPFTQSINPANPDAYPYSSYHSHLSEKSILLVRDEMLD
ncbi:MAG: hypothetical protein ACI85I_002616 [Arenicella sp.]|jgi:hypothetical protein